MQFKVQTKSIKLKELDKCKKANRHADCIGWHPGQYKSICHNGHSCPKLVSLLEGLPASWSWDETTPRDVTDREATPLYEREVCTVDFSGLFRRIGSFTYMGWLPLTFEKAADEPRFYHSRCAATIKPQRDCGTGICGKRFSLLAKDHSKRRGFPAFPYGILRLAKYRPFMRNVASIIRKVVACSVLARMNCCRLLYAVTWRSWPLERWGAGQQIDNRLYWIFVCKDLDSSRPAVRFFVLSSIRGNEQ